MSANMRLKRCRTIHLFTSYLGIDICDEAVYMAKGGHRGARFAKGDAVDFSSPERFDSAIATDVLLYLSPEDQIRALLNLREALHKEAPLFVRWAPGENTTQMTKIMGTKIEGWAFLPSKVYIKELFRVAGFTLTEPVRSEPELMNNGADEERYQVFFENIRAKSADGDVD